MKTKVYPDRVKPSGNCIPSCSMTDASGLMKLVIMNFTLSIHSFCANNPTGLTQNAGVVFPYLHVTRVLYGKNFESE